MRELTSRKDCICIFKEYNLSERDACDLIVKSMSLSNEEEIELTTVANKAYLTCDMNIVFKGGNRYKRLCKAFKTYIKL